MQARFVFAPRFGITRANCEVNGATNLFIKEHVLCEALDAVIGADAPFAQEAGASIGIEGGSEEFLILAGFFFDHLAVFEPQLYIMNFLPAEDGRILKTDPTIYRFFHRSGEDLAIREVLFACTFDKRSVFDR